MNKYFLRIIIIFIFMTSFCFGKHLYKESCYQKVWCKNHSGILEYKNQDGTRVDCLTKTHAVEFDFASKWAESVGQALYYGMITGKKGMVVLIIENPSKDYKHFKKVQFMAKNLNFDVDCMTLDSIIKNKENN